LSACVGTLVHDGWAPYREWACGHALCHAQHLRELTFLFEEQGHAWAKRLIDLLVLACHRAPPSGKRGRTRPSKAVNLLHRLRRYADDVRFMTDSGVPFTNTLAEQAVRMSKVTQKVSGCFRTRVGARAFCTIPSHLDTLRKQGIHPFRALTQTFQGKVPQPRFVEPPLLQAVSLPGDILSSYVFFSCTSGKSSRRSPRS